MTFNIDFNRLPTTPQPLDVVRESQELNERLLTRAYSMVAEAERLIAQQRQRIKVLESLSYADELTGVLNRRGFDMALTREISNAQRDPGATGMVVLVDLDGFKGVNDHFGHPAGDAYLQAVATTLGEIVREGDIVARIGGDEFAIIMPRVKASTSQRRATAMMAQLNSTSMKWRDLSLPLMASFGATTYSAIDTNASVFKRADERLYVNKTQRKVGRQKA